MRSIVLFQTFANIVLGAAIVFLLSQVDSKLDDMIGIERTAAQSLDEAVKANEILQEILVTLKASNVPSPPAAVAQ